MQRTAPRAIDVTECERDADTWNDWVRRSPHGTVFHRNEALDALAEHTDARLHRLVAARGDDPVGVFPVFELSKGPATAAFSPPPGMGLPNLGPGLVGDHDRPPAERARTAAHLVDACWRWLRDEIAPSYVHVRTADRFTDLHSFDRTDEFDVTPQFTYVLDLDPGRDALLRSFSSDARSNVRDADDRVTVRETDGQVRHDTIRRVVAQLEERYAEQGMTYPVNADFAIALHDHLPDGWVRPYEVRLDGEFVGGMIVLDDGDTVYRWQGGAKPDADAPVNDRLDWHIIEAALDRGRTRYDLVGANTTGLCEYKAKFNPSLVTYYSIERSTHGMRLVADLYQRLRNMNLHPKANGSRHTPPN
jgi:CelD/BcsL family acetyltransferase involved in cellulose biosynthesis